MRTYQEKLSQIAQETQTTISQTQRKLTKILNQLQTINSYNIIITTREDQKTKNQIKAINNIKYILNEIYKEL